MIISRRSLLGGAASAGVLFPLRSLDAAAVLPTPHREALKNGALIWIRGEDDWVPYSSDNEAAEFESSLDVALKRDMKLLEEMPHLEDMTYEEFYASYFFGDPIYGEIGYSSQQSFGVGHVAIVRIVDDQFRVLEASGYKFGLRDISLQDWLASQDVGTQFWIGHFQQFEDAEINKILEIISSEISANKSYDFWSFDLEDPAAFYCSKLIWYAVYKATGRRLDGGIARPLPWFSPKQLLASSYISVVASPGDY